MIKRYNNEYSYRIDSFWKDTGNFVSNSLELGSNWDTEAGTKDIISLSVNNQYLR